MSSLDSGLSLTAYLGNVIPMQSDREGGSDRCGTGAVGAHRVRISKALPKKSWKAETKTQGGKHI